MIFLEKTLTGPSSQAHCCSIITDDSSGGREREECMPMFRQISLPPTLLLKINIFVLLLAYTNNEHNSMGNFRVSMVSYLKIATFTRIPQKNNCGSPQCINKPMYYLSMSLGSKPSQEKFSVKTSNFRLHAH